MTRSVVAQVEKISTETNTNYPSVAVRWRTVIVLLLLNSVSLLDRNAMALLIEPIRNDLGITDVEISLLIGLAFALFYGIMGIPLGWAIDRYPRRPILFLCVTIWSLATAGCGVVSGFIGLFIARLTVGAGEAAVQPASQAILADSFPPEKLALPMSVFQSGAKLGESMSLLITGALAAILTPALLFSFPSVGLEFRGWQLIFILIGLPGTLIALLIFTIPEPPRRVVPNKLTGAFGDYIKFFRTHFRLMGLLHLGALLYMTAWTATTGWAPAFFQRVHHWSPAQTGLALGTAMLIGPLCGMMLHGIAVDRLFARFGDAHFRYMQWLLLLSVPLATAAFLMPNPHVAVVFIGLYYLVACGLAPVITTVLQIIIPGTLRGLAAAVMLLVGAMTGALLGPVLVATITDYGFEDPNKIGWSLAITISGVSLGSAVAFKFARKWMKRAIETR